MKYTLKSCITCRSLSKKKIFYKIVMAAILDFCINMISILKVVSDMTYLINIEK